MSDQRLQNLVKILRLAYSSEFSFALAACRLTTARVLLSDLIEEEI